MHDSFTFLIFSNTIRKDADIGVPPRVSTTHRREPTTIISIHRIRDNNVLGT